MEAKMNWTKMITNTCSEINLEGTTKLEIIHSLAQLAMNNEALAYNTEEEIVQQILAREKQGSTAIGEQIAIPHAEIANLHKFVICIATHHEGLNFDSIDKKPVKLFFLILGPKGKPYQHLQILAAVSRTVSQTITKEQLLQATDKKTLYETFLSSLTSTQISEKRQTDKKMLYLFISSKKILNPILELFLQEDIYDINIFEGSNMGAYISTAPLFVGFLNPSDQGIYKTKMIQAFIPDEQLDDLLTEIETITKNHDAEDALAWYITAVERWKGSARLF